MSSSESLMEGLKELLKCPISFVCVIRLHEEDYIFCLGRHSFFFLDKELSKIVCEIYLAHIETVLIETQHPSALQFQLSENRDSNIPAKMNVFSDDRRLLITHLLAAWKTDYMFRKGKINNLCIYKSQFLDFKHEEIEKKNTLPSLVIDPFAYKVGYNRYELKQYCFFLPSEYEPRKQVGIYENKEVKNCKIMLQITDLMPLEILRQLGDREELKFYAQIFLEGIMGDRNDYWIMSSKIYYKRNNLTFDSAQWSGWEIHIKEPRRDSIIIILRRKFIPPIMDNFQDFALVLRGPLVDQTIQRALSIPTPDLMVFPNSVHTSYVLYSKYDSLKYITHAREMADSLFSTISLLSSQQKYDSPYKCLTEEMINGLLFDEDAYFFFQYKKEIKPKQISIGISYLQAILKELSFSVDGYSKISKELATKYKDESFDSGLNSNSPSQVLSKYIESFNFEKNLPKNWLFKLSRYLSYCVDGGLLIGRFSIVDIIQNYSGSQHSSSLLRVLFFLLHLTAEKGELDGVFFEEKNSNFDFGMIYERIKKMYLSPHLFNERVMKVLIENDFFSTEFKKISANSNESPQAYADFLIHLLTVSKSSALKASICRHLISYQAEIKKQEKDKNEDEYMKIVFKTLCKPLIDMYKNKNKTLATLACVALLNICWNSKDLKYLIVFEGAGKISINYMTSRDESLLRYSLQLILSLCTVFQNLEAFMKMELMEKLMNILEGTNIPGTSYSNKVVSIVFQILKSIIANTDKDFEIIERKMDFIIELFHIYCDVEEVEIEILGILKRIAMKNDGCKSKISKTILKQCLDNLSQKSTKIKDVTLQILVVLSKDDEKFLEDVEKNDGKNLIKNIIQKEGKDSPIYKQGLYLMSKMKKKT